MISAPEDCRCPLTPDPGPSLVNSSTCPGTFLFMILLESYLMGRCKIADPCNRLISEENLADSYDFIVIGAGSAGSIVAGRLSENINNNVLLIEAGSTPPVGVKVPSMYGAFSTNTSLTWGYYTVPANFCLDQEGARCSWPRGKGIGGSSLLNGMMYLRGHAADFGQWVEAGAIGWSWEENMPFIFMTENNKDIGTVVSGEYHSDQGVLPIQRFRHQGELVDKLISALNQSGFDIISDVNDPNTPTGFAVAQAYNDNGQRYTTARAYLKPKSERPNLSIKMNAQVTRILIDNNNRAYAVEFVDENGDKKIVTALKEIILSAGALNTPQILMHSGIGPKEMLERFRIPVIADLPVGQNLRNHIGMNLYLLLENAENTEQLNWDVLTQYLLNLEGPMTSTSITQVTGFLYSSLADIENKQPDLQFFFNGLAAGCSKTGQIGERVSCEKYRSDLFITAVGLLPRSIGYMTLNSSDPLEPLLFYPNYFTEPEDMILLKDGARYMKKFIESDIMRNKYGASLHPENNAHCSSQFEEWSDEWLECNALYHTDPQNHQMGTAAIGLVIDPELRVYGIDGLRVADASVMPTQVTGNPQGTIMMVAEKAAHFIKTKWN